MEQDHSAEVYDNAMLSDFGRAGEAQKWEEARERFPSPEFGHGRDPRNTGSNFVYFRPPASLCLVA